MPELDVRDVPPAERHPTIMDTFESMDSGETLTLINDHEPSPLYYEMKAEIETFDDEAYSVRREGVEKYVAEFPKE